MRRRILSQAHCIKLNRRGHDPGDSGKGLVSSLPPVYAVAESVAVLRLILQYWYFKEEKVIRKNYEAIYTYTAHVR